LLFIALTITSISNTLCHLALVVTFKKLLKTKIKCISFGVGGLAFLKLKQTPKYSKTNRKAIKHMDKIETQRETHEDIISIDFVIRQT